MDERRRAMRRARPGPEGSPLRQAFKPESGDGIHETHERHDSGRGSDDRRTNRVGESPRPSHSFLSFFLCLFVDLPFTFFGPHKATEILSAAIHFAANEPSQRRVILSGAEVEGGRSAVEGSRGPTDDFAQHRDPSTGFRPAFARDGTPLRMTHVLWRFMAAAGNTRFVKAPA